MAGTDTTRVADSGGAGFEKSEGDAWAAAAYELDATGYQPWPSRRIDPSETSFGITRYR